MHTWVISLESQDYVALGVENQGVTSHGCLGETLFLDVEIRKETSLLIRAVDSLEGVAVKMERVTSGVEVVDDDLDNLILPENHGVGIGAVDGRVSGVLAGGEDAVERGDLGVDVGDVVEPGVVGTVAEVVHHDVQSVGLVRLWEKRHFVVWDEGHVVKGVEGVDGCSGRKGLGLVVDEPAGGVVVEVFGEDVEESLRVIL